LDLKSRAMRLALLDDVPMTAKGIEVLRRIVEEKDLYLWTTNTTDQYDTENPKDGEIIVEGGEVFFKKD
jgi:hypothetical protein